MLFGHAKGDRERLELFNFLEFFKPLYRYDTQVHVALANRIEIRKLLFHQPFQSESRRGTVKDVPGVRTGIFEREIRCRPASYVVPCIRLLRTARVATDGARCNSI